MTTSHRAGLAVLTVGPHPATTCLDDPARSSTTLTSGGLLAEHSSTGPRGQR